MSYIPCKLLKKCFTYKTVKNANQSQMYCKYLEIPLFGSFYQVESDSTDSTSTHQKNLERIRLKLPIIGKCVTSNYYKCVSKVLKYNFQYLEATFKFLKAPSNFWKAMLILSAIQSLQLEFLNLEVFTNQSNIPRTQLPTF